MTLEAHANKESFQENPIAKDLSTIKRMGNGDKESAVRCLKCLEKGNKVTKISQVNHDVSAYAYDSQSTIDRNSNQFTRQDVPTNVPHSRYRRDVITTQNALLHFNETTKPTYENKDTSLNPNNDSTFTTLRNDNFDLHPSNRNGTRAKSQTPIPNTIPYSHATPTTSTSEVLTEFLPHTIYPEALLNSNQTEQTKIWENGLLSYDQVKSIRIITRWTFVAITTPGIPLAILSAIVFTNRRMQNRSSRLVVTFNLSEGLKTLCYVIHRLWKLWLRDEPITWASPFAFFFIYVVTWLPDSLGRISLLVNTLVSIDRFIKLVFPMASLSWQIIRHPNLAIALCVAIPVLANLSSTFLMLVFIKPKLDTTVRFTPDEIIALVAVIDPYIFSIYVKIHIVVSVCFRYIPLVVTITINMIAIISIYRQQRSRLLGRQNSVDSSSTPVASEKNKNRQNNTMIVISILLFSFLVSIKPSIRVFSAFHPTIGEGKQDLYIYYVINEVAVFLDNFAPVVTFTAYWMLGTYFRKSLRELFSSKKSSQSITRSQRSLSKREESLSREDTFRRGSVTDSRFA